ncbi:hypothetical protein T439DRAFT_252301 [Meredithblackwellia eburnea MCA 4105]
MSSRRKVSGAVPSEQDGAMIKGVAWSSTYGCEGRQINPTLRLIINHNCVGRLSTPLPLKGQVTPEQRQVSNPLHSRPIPDSPKVLRGPDGNHTRVISNFSVLLFPPGELLPQVDQHLVNLLPGEPGANCDGPPRLGLQEISQQSSEIWSWIFARLFYVFGEESAH